ncbi:MAG: class I SAM-dependent methyltransferase [candidate division Zixibacteria bacterium]|nr:class I SAM-dependent methyltransferase [candidate division Zixibacteria bacterium]
MTIESFEPQITNLKSQLPTYNQMKSEVYKDWIGELREGNKFNRKQWEHIYILQALRENNLLRDGVSGLGFGVGDESLPAVMAKNGCSVLATEINIEKPNEDGWVKGKNVDEQLAALNKLGICEKDKFKNLVSFRDVDMNHVPSDLNDFDFTWSSCALEHLGTMKHGEDFIFNSLKCLKPGGLAVHTTEFTLAKSKTVDHGFTVFYREKDIISLAKRLQNEGHEISLNFFKGRSFADWNIDFAPYRDKKHIKLIISKQWKLLLVTSIGLLIRKSSLS